MIYIADIIINGDGDMKGKKVQESDYVEFIDKTIEILDKFKGSELWSCIRLNGTREYSILWKVLVTIKERKGERYANKLNRLYDVK